MTPEKFAEFFVGGINPEQIPMVRKANNIGRSRMILHIHVTVQII